MTKPTRRTRDDLETEIVKLRERLEEVDRVRTLAVANEAATRQQFNDLKSRLAAAEQENARMRGYIARVHEDDVVREELVRIGDPEGAEQLVPKRKPTYFAAPAQATDFTADAERSSRGGWSAINATERDRPRHWVTY